MPTNESVSISHNVSASRFEARIGDQLAYAEYETNGSQRTFTHTYVPDSLRGRGIAQALVKEALDDTRKRGLRAVAQCSYVVTYLERHPEASS